jgi:hypothetical protein
MDLLDINEKTLYFDEPLAKEAEQLISEAADQYGQKDVEPLLVKAHKIAPEHLTVLVALYRYYYYQHRLEDALIIAHQALGVSRQRLKFPYDWRTLTIDHLGAGALISMGMVRFYLLALKAAGYLNLRLGNWQEATEMLAKVSDLDKSDRLGSAALLEIANSIPKEQRSQYTAM